MAAAGPAPAAPGLQAASDSGAGNSDRLTADNTPTFDVTGAPYFRVYRDGQLVSDPLAAGTSFTSAALADGTYSFTVSAVDAGGNETPQSDPTTVTIDTLPPAAVPAAPNVTQAGGTGYGFSVTYFDPGAVDAASLGGGNVVVSGPGGFSQAATLVSVDAPGNGSPRTATYRITPPGGVWSAAADGTYTLSAGALPARDLAGNVIPAARALGTFAVAADSLCAPVLLAATDSGTSNSDRITNFNNASPAKALRFSVVGAVPGALVALYADGNPIGSATAPNAPAGSPPGTTVTVTVPTDGVTVLPDGTHNFTARQRPAGGDYSADSPALQVTILTATPAAPAAPVLEAASDSGFSHGDGLTNQAAPTFDVAAPGPGILHLGSYGSDGPSLSLPVGAAGTYPFPFNPALTFNPVGTAGTPTAYDQGLYTADLNGDGKPDLIVPSANNSASIGNATILLGNGNGTFRRTAVLPVAPPAPRPWTSRSGT